MPGLFRSIDSLFPDMNWPDADGPPSKRRRFFSDPEEENGDIPTTTVAPIARSPLEPRDDATNRGPGAGIGDNAAPAPVSPPLKHSGFDRATFEAFIGDSVAEETLSILREKCGTNIEAAVNMYFDGTWKNFRKVTNTSATQSTLDRLGGSRSSASVTNRTRVPEAPISIPILQSIPESQYIGAFGVEGWATRSGSNLLKHGEAVRLERQKLQNQRMGSGKLRVDVIVRFTDSKGTEIGRLAKEAAHWISALIDQNVCRFEGTCVYAPDRLRTNDTVFLQLRCFIKTACFETKRPTTADNRNTGLFEVNETVEERDLRLRQIALVRLFQEINIEPSRSAAKHNRQGLLDAAETAETKEKQSAKPPKTNGDPVSSPPSDEAEEGEELEQDQLDALYKKAQSFDFNTPEAEPPDTFAMTLRPYQKQSLHWMLSKEKDLKNENREASMHPLWEEYTWPVKDVDDKDVPQIKNHPTFYVNPYSGEMSLDFPVQEQHCLGGILADEMGLGKTIQMLSLVHSHKYEQKPSEPMSEQTGKQTSKTTLVIAPMSLLAQWQSEAENASKEGTLKSMVYYGTEKSANLQALCTSTAAPDVIVTSYGVVLSEFNQYSKQTYGNPHTGLFSFKFFRVILDEGHNIKNRQAKTSKACYELTAEHRWVLTGTPIVNRLEDLFSLVRFLKVEPWNNFSFWRTFITVPFESKDFMRALDVVQTVLEPLVMRRTKDMKTPDGQPLVPLPPKTVEIVSIELSKQERDVYDHIFNRAKRTFSANVEKGTVMKAYTTIFAQILRLRQSCCHPILVRNQEVVADEEMAGAEADAAAGLADDMDLDTLMESFKATLGNEKNANAYGAHVLEQIRNEAAHECPICSEEPMIEHTVTGCWHSACKKCLLDYIKHHTDKGELPRCFNCREPINNRDLFQVIRHDDDPDTRSSTPKVSLQRFGVNESSSKVVALLKHLRELRKEHPCMKSVVFSQFTSFMTLMEPALARANMKFLRLDGTMSQKARASVIEEFRNSDKFTVFLISLKSGGVGLNLTQAKRVFMMDPWWSFAVEAQAIDRVHRMGQDDEVKVYRFITENSVEERMLRIQDRKKFIATSLGMMSDEEKRLQRIEDIKDLLS
ncbi:SNF2 superfamily RAD5 protein [Pestalotiopsis sp. NC0098]|nr:SNF2 superfamily RAD5 protein [Pestalotiopsis sp. NC0098]